MKGEKILFLFCIILLVSLASPVGHTEDNYKTEQKVDSQFSISYIGHSRIEIKNDTDFAYQASLEGWDGDGSSDTPYIIEGYNITDDLMCIYIHDVSVYFIIRNCFINSSTGPSDPGIYLYNATHARIEDSFITWHTYAIYAQDCPDVVIDGCTITESGANTIWIITSDRAVLSNNQVFNNGYRIYIQSSDYATIYNNKIHDNNWQGLSIETSDFLNITGNTIENNGYDGINLDLCNNATIYDNDIGENGYVSGSGNGLYMSDGYDNIIDTNRMWNNSYCGLYLHESGNNQIKDNQVFDHRVVGIYSYTSPNCNVTGNDVWGNGRFEPSFGSGIYIDMTHGYLIEDNQAWNNSYAGIFLDTAYECVIENNQVWNNSNSGIYLEDASDYNQIKDNQIFNNSVHGISVYDSSYVNVTGNDIWGNSWNSEISYVGAITTSGCEYWNISGNTIYDNSHHGMYLYGNHFDIWKNQIYDNNESGITTVMTTYHSIIENKVHGHDVGIYVYSQNTNVTHNIVYDNEYGIQTFGSTNVSLYYNDLAWNTVNAEEIACYNVYWHDNQSIGNWYGDYSGTGSYEITNGTDIVNLDLYPHKSIELGGLTGLSYEFGETGTVGVWFAQALNPSHFEVYANGSLLYSETWDGTSIETNLDGLPVGYNEIMLIAYHISGHSINASSSVTVTDTIEPSWVTIPTDQEITVGESFSYQVTATDLSGIGSYSLNDTLHFQISAAGLITNIVPLETGVYGLQITVVDIYGNELTIAITVTVVAAPPSDMTLYLILAVGAGVIIIALLLVIFMKKQTR